MLRRLQRLYLRYMTHHLCLPLGVVRGVDGCGVPVTLLSGRVCLLGDGVLEHAGGRAEGATPSLPCDPTRPVRVSLRGGGGTVRHLPSVPRARRALAHAALWPGLALRLCTLVSLLPAIRDPHIRARALRRLGLESDPPAPQLCLVHPEPARRPPGGRITLILPVHNATRHVARCLDRIQRMTDLPWRLGLMESSSPAKGAGSS